eukprot:scaffold7213_cov166-Amphora_coffeaeformis.AAC.5
MSLATNARAPLPPDADDGSQHPPQRRTKGSNPKKRPRCREDLAVQQHPLVQALRRIDPILQFLCKATGQVLIDWTLLRKSLPVVTLAELQALQDRGVLRVVQDNEQEQTEDGFPGSSPCCAIKNDDDDESSAIWKVGFPPPPLTTEATEGKDGIHANDLPSAANENQKQKPPLPSGNKNFNMLLHGTTKKGAQQRLQWLQKQLQHEADALLEANPPAIKRLASSPIVRGGLPQNKEITPTTKLMSVAVTPEEKLVTVADGPPISPRTSSRQIENVIEDDVNTNADEMQAFQDLKRLMKWNDDDNKNVPHRRHGEEKDDAIHCQPVGKSAVPQGILPRQCSFAGSQAAQPAVYADLQSQLSSFIPENVYRAVTQDKPLYRHQVQAITAALRHQHHVSLTTGTGSGKSLAFLLPVVATLVQEDRTAILLFPTKALAQDQFTKLQALAARLSDQDYPGHKPLRPATMDGDTPHSQRKAIAESANLILTNPDTLHAAILPNWEKVYPTLLAKLAFVVVDEAHSYQGIFGAHVSLILARLRRVCAVARARLLDDEDDGRGVAKCLPLRFIAASATLPWPEIHVRKLCPIGVNEPVAVIAQDTSPRAAKHFFVWNPPLLSAQGVSSGSVTMSGKKKSLDVVAVSPPVATLAATTGKKINDDDQKIKDERIEDTNIKGQRYREPKWHRRHAADETALLLARAVSQGVRCMAFAKTRNLVEWVFERTIAALNSDPETAHLVDKVESYRGGYTRSERRKIEERLFRNELLGVVGTNALELGVDVGGIDLTLHCGYPSSYGSLLQQAGRAGRGRSQAISCAIVVCFNSPSEQHLWRYPSTLLSKGLAPTDTIPLNKSTVQSHILCASSEFPVTGKLPAECIVTETSGTEFAISDWHLFGGQKLYEDALEELNAANSCTAELICIPSNPTLTLYKAHPLMKKAWSHISIRSIEPVNYNIVDLNHPGQGGRTDGIYNEAAILDTLPYSRVFYHAHPGAIITHRGTRYKVVSMTRPPEALSDSKVRSWRNMQLSAFAKPTSARYSTRPLSTMHITIVKQFEGVELKFQSKMGMKNCRSNFDSPEPTSSKAITSEKERMPKSLAEVAASFSESKMPAEGAARRYASVEDAKDPIKEQETYVTSFSGCGVVNVKRTVHGYKKLSLITRTEISRSELSLPEMEFETFGIWFDTEPHVLTAFLGSKYGEGVHALSHALLAVAPLFEPGLVRDDLECDHSYFSPTRLVLFDERAGGSGSCERLWKHFFAPENNIVDAAIDLLVNCESCVGDEGYEGGCPACLHASQCLKFNMNLSRSAAIVVGRRMLERIKLTDLYKNNEKMWLETKKPPLSPSRNLTPRRKARYNALKKAKEMKMAQSRQFIVGRPSFVRTEGGNRFAGHQQEHE